MTERPLSGRVALITGAGVRLGRGIALGVARLGADVALHCHASSAGARELAQLVRVDGGRAEVFEADLSASHAAERLVADVEAALGPLDALVNSAAVFDATGFLDTAAPQLERLWAVNVRAPFLLCQAAARRMRGRGRGDIVNVLDVAGAVQTWSGPVAYAMTKAALASLTRSLAVTLAPEIRVNGVAPGLVLPRPELDEAALEALVARIPARRVGDPDDVVAAVQFFLAGPRFVTGQVLAVDGARSLG